MATKISQNQYDYLTNLSKGKTATGGVGTSGQAAWAKQQLAQSTYTPVSPQTQPMVNNSAFPAQTVGVPSALAAGSGMYAGRSAFSQTPQTAQANVSQAVASRPSATSVPTTPTNYSPQGQADAYIAARGMPSNPATFTAGSNPTSTSGTTDSAQSYIDSNRPGGMNSYAAIQRDRYRQAVASNDVDLINRLNADAVRVGYSLQDPGLAITDTTTTDTPPTDQPPADQPPAPDYSWITDMVNNELTQQKTALDQELARLKQSSELTVNQNNSFLQDQIKTLEDNRVKVGAEIVNFQNRRGSFYSGGVDFQTSHNNDSYAQAEGAATKDIAARNADIWNNNNLLAQQASEKLAALQSQAPDRIRQLIEEQKSKDAALALQTAGVTGNYMGQRTLAGQQLDLNKSIDQRNFDYGITRDNTADSHWQQTFDSGQAQIEWDNAFKQGQFDYQRASDAWERAFKDKSFAQSVQEAAASRGLQWASLNQQQQHFIADQAFRDKQFKYQMIQDNNKNAEAQFGQGMEAFKATGKMPSFMSDYGIDVGGMNNPAIKDDLNAMYGQISSGTKPEALLKTIDDKVKLGLEDKSNGDKLKSALYKLYPDLDPSAPKSGPSTASKFLPFMNFTPTWNPIDTSFLNLFK